MSLAASDSATLRELLVEFRDSLDENRDMAATEIAHLDAAPNDSATVNAVFRALHNIKGNAQMCTLERLSAFAHHIESMFSAVREGRLDYTREIGEVVLLALDEIRHLSMKMSDGGELDEAYLAQLEAGLDSVRDSTAAALRANARRVIEQFTGKISTSPAVPPPASVTITPPGETSDGLGVFRDLAQRLDARLSYWNGRLARTLPLLLKLNAAAPRPVDARQLEAALYLHDIGNAFLPEAMLVKDDKLTGAEWELMKQHPAIGAALLRQIPGWDEAAIMVEQHHVWADGSQGYPVVVPPQQLHEGAKMLAIIDSYESMTHPRPDRQFRRSVLRAITEINSLAGRQFSAELVPVFNAIVREHIARQG